MANNTKGALRRGNRTGRPVYAQGERTRKIAVLLSEGHILIAQAIGQGSASQGIRSALTQIALESVGKVNG